jgi:hypothetical protein
MSVDRGVTCYHCGASATLPEDLRTPTFTCSFCTTVLETARYAGSMAVSADALAAHLHQGLAKAAAGKLDLDAHIASAPRLEHGSAGHRTMPCRLCQAPLAVPLDVTVHGVTCQTCNHPQRVADYISDRERFEIDMQRQVAGNEALKRLEAEGAPCTKCGGHTPVPERGLVQLACVHCGATILLQDHVDASAVARHRLAQQVFASMGEARVAHDKQKRTRDNLILGVMLAGFGIAALIGLLSR